MATTTQRSQKKEEKPNSCRALITTRDPKNPPNPPLSYIISITCIPQPKIRIKIPQLLVKTIQRRSQKCTDTETDVDHCKKKKKKWAKPGKLIPKKFGSIFCNVFANKKSSEMCSLNGGNDRGHRDGDRFKEFNGVKESSFFENVEPDDLGSVNSTSKSSANSTLSCGDETLPLALESLSSKSSQSLKEILEINEDEEGIQKRFADRKIPHRSITNDKPTLKAPLSFSSFFNKKTCLDFIKEKINKTSGSCINSSHSGSNSTNGGDSSANGHGTSYGVIKIEESAGNLALVEQEEEEEDGGKEVERDGDDEELCKKRILMGEKCRPLNFSGTLHYDKNGILLPEEVLP